MPAVKLGERSQVRRDDGCGEYQRVGGIWDELPTGFTVLAPMEGVTDVVFRQVIARAGRLAITRTIERCVSRIYVLDILLA